MTILVLAGTADGRDLAKALASKGYEVYATTVTEYGAKLFQGGLKVLTGALDRETFTNLVTEKHIQAVVDATHPYAKNISIMAMELSAAMDLCYIRYEREKIIEDSAAHIIRVKDYEEARDRLVGFDDIFLTIGSRQLQKFADLFGMGKRMIARVLPDSEVLRKCEELGFTPNSIIAMQGPFSTDMNYQMFKEWGAKIVVTKDSGTPGGVLEKIEAARELDIPVLMIDRPKLNYPEIVRDIKGVFNKLEAKNLSPLRSSSKN